MSIANSGFSPATSDRALGAWVFTTPDGRRWLEEAVLPGWIPTRRWFGSKAREITRMAVEAAMPVAGELLQALVVRVEYAVGEPERYSVPLGCSPASAIDQPDSAIVAHGQDELVLHDAAFHPRFRAALFELMRTGTEFVSGSDSLRGTQGQMLAGGELPGESQVLGVEQSNTSILYGSRYFLKLFRRLEPGVNPDAELSRFLSEREAFRHIPPFAGELVLVIGGAEPMPFALLLGRVHNRGDAWNWALERLRGYFEQRDAAPDSTTLARLAQLGERTAELHLALLTDDEAIAFEPEALTVGDFQALSQSVFDRLDKISAALRSRPSPLAEEVLRLRDEIRSRIEALATLQPGTVKTRHHGDYHLGQVLDTGDDWMIIDFEGEPLRPLTERRAKRSPLRDVAGMLRSLHYAPHAVRPDAEESTLARAEAWTDAASAAFLDRYFSVAEGATFLPPDPAERKALLDAFILEKALYEIDYELNNRPDWLPIPLRGVLKVLRAT